MTEQLIETLGTNFSTSVAVAAAAAPLGSAIIMPALVNVTEDLHSTPTITNLNVAMYMLSMSIFPLWWSSFSETFGRRSIYLISFTLFTVWGVLSAVATNIGMLVTMRVLSGGAAASVQAVGGGTIADIWEPKERGRAMGLFYLGPLCGPLFAPIIGGGLDQGLGWRSTQWFLVIYGGLTFLGLLFFLPETLKSKRDFVAEAERETEQKMPLQSGKSDLQRVSTRQSVHRKTKSFMLVIRRVFIDPLSIITYFRFPAVLATVYYSSISFGSLYVLNISIQSTFSKPPYNFSSAIVGLSYIPNSVGYCMTSIFGGRWIDYIMHREAKKAGRYDEKGRLILKPEDRMRENAWLGAVVYPLALIWYGWTVQKGVFWVVPVSLCSSSLQTFVMHPKLSQTTNITDHYQMIANFFFGVGSMLIFALVTTMLTEFLPKRASSGIALNNFARNIFSCVGAIIADPVINAIGNGWLFTILGLVSLFSGSATVWAMKRWGAQWARTMNEKLGNP